MSITRQAVILVGGQGTRLGALTVQTPKPLLSVGRQPFLNYVIELGVGVTRLPHTVHQEGLPNAGRK